MTVRLFAGKVSWFDLDTTFGFAALEHGVRDAFLHLSALNRAGHISP